jgi:hypothetical protein
MITAQHGWMEWLVSDEIENVTYAIVNLVISLLQLIILRLTRLQRSENLFIAYLHSDYGDKC